MISALGMSPNSTIGGSEITYNPDDYLKLKVFFDLVGITIHTNSMEILKVEMDEEEK